LSTVLLPLLQQILTYLLNQILYPKSEVQTYEGTLPVNNPDDGFLDKYEFLCH
jgi:hypothetical protein